MNDSTTVVGDDRLNSASEGLADRLDPAISDATTGMSMLLTDLVRRSLRSGVQRIDEELQSLVVDKVERALAERTPAIEQQAVDVAENAARIAATEVVVDEVRALEARTTERAEALLNQLAGVETASIAHSERKAAELTARIDEAERRVNETNRAALKDRLEALLQESQGTTEGLREEIRALTERWEKSVQAAQATHGNLRDQLKSVEAVLVARLDKHAVERQQADAGLRDDIERKLAAVRNDNQRLIQRLEALEQPRGMKAVFGKLFGSKAAG